MAAQPCHFPYFKNGDMVVPDLGARVTKLRRCGSAGDLVAGEIYQPYQTPHSHNASV